MCAFCKNICKLALIDKDGYLSGADDELGALFDFVSLPLIFPDDLPQVRIKVDSHKPEFIHRKVAGNILGMFHSKFNKYKFCNTRMHTQC